MEKKKGITLAVAAVAFSTIGLANLTVTKTSADEVKNSQTSSVQDLSQFDKFIEVYNNKFIVKDSDGKIPNTTLSEINNVVSDTNKYILDNNLTIDPSTKMAIQYVSFGNTNSLARSYGKNGILAIRWNSVRVGLDKGLTNDILHGGVAGAGFYLGFLAGGPAAGAAVAIATVIVDRHLDTKSGWWFDYNVYLRRVTNFGRQ